MGNGMAFLLLGAALAVLGGAWTAALLWILAAGLRQRGAPRREAEETPEEIPEEELRRSAAVQEGFDNLMRYCVAAARDEDARCEIGGERES